MGIQKQLQFQGDIFIIIYSVMFLPSKISHFVEDLTRRVSKLKQEKSQQCDCKNKEERNNQKMLKLEEKYNAQKVQLKKKDREITGHIVENKKLMKKISELRKHTR